MTGASGFRRSELVLKETFFRWLDSLRKTFRMCGPVNIGSQTVFREINSSKELSMDYGSTMLSPGKLFIYKPREEIVQFSLRGEISIDELPLPSERQVLVGVHPCDTNAIWYLDKPFLGLYRDPYYAVRRENTIIISLNCARPSPNCFCSSVGAGPFLKAEAGKCDFLLTDFEEAFLIEIISRRAAELWKVNARKAGLRELNMKSEKEQSVLDKITKRVNMEGLNKLFLDNLDHPVWHRTAEGRCLSCSNCVMVCPTCFCYSIVDETSMDMKTVRRFRHLDACQDIKFAEVFGGNFRQHRAARLRQFVTHKMNQTEQYGVPGTVGCGRCITWCPTGIDLTEMTKEIQSS